MLLWRDSSYSSSIHLSFLLYCVVKFDLRAGAYFSVRLISYISPGYSWLQEALPICLQSANHILLDAQDHAHFSLHSWPKVRSSMALSLLINLISSGFGRSRCNSTGLFIVAHLLARAMTIFCMPGRRMRLPVLVSVAREALSR